MLSQIVFPLDLAALVSADGHTMICAIVRLLFGAAGKLDAASERRAQLLQDHKAVKTQLQALDTTAAAGRAGAIKSDAAVAAEASDSAASDRDSGSDDNPVVMEARKAERAQRQKQQRALHQQRKDICAELDRTRAAVRPSLFFVRALEINESRHESRFYRRYICELSRMTGPVSKSMQRLQRLVSICTHQIVLVSMASCIPAGPNQASVHPQVASGRDAVQREGKDVRQRVVVAAHVVACTLSSAGGELAALLPPDVRFEALIIDEVALPGSSCTATRPACQLSLAQETA